MMPIHGQDRVTSYDVRIWKIRTYKGRRGTTYTVRWTVAGREWSDTFKTYALADSARGELLAAARIGEAFDVATGRPISKSARREEQSWFDFACRYVDLKWPTAAGNTRRGIAETLTSATPALFASERNRPSDETIRGALHGWAFNAMKRAVGEPDDEDQAAAVRWLRRNTVPVSALAEPATLRATLDLLARKLDGAAAAGSTVRRKRAVLHNALEYALEVGVLVSNPMSSLKWKAPKVAEAVDRRVVVNPKQASQLLDAVGVQGRTGRHLVAFFGAMYYSALRPGEAADLREASLELPDEGWGQLILSRSAPTTGAAWSNSGQRRDHRQLKHRAAEDVRVVPCPPQLVGLLREHLAEFGVDREGRLFRGVRGGQLSESVYSRVWQKAREKVFSPPSQVLSPLAGRPYDLRHAAVSTWLSGGVEATRVAEWAGHSVHVLLRVYAKCIDGQEDAARRRVEAALHVD